MIERLEVGAGEGTVIRFGQVAAWAGADATPALLSFLSQSARNLSSSPAAGQQLVDHLAGVLSVRDPEPEVPFAVVGPAPQGWAALLHGPVQIWDGWEWTTVPRPPGWVRTTLRPHPALAIVAVGVAAPVTSPDSLLDLVAGVVPGGGLVLAPSSSNGGRADRSGATSTILLPAGEPADPTVVAGADVPEAPEDPTVVAVADPTEVVPVTDPVADGGSAARRPEWGEPTDLRRPELLSGVVAYPPLPRGRSAEQAPSGSAVVAGLLCPRGHLNRPGMRECARCGETVAQDRAQTVSGTRPALGCLVLDDHSIYRLDRGYLLGTDPGADPTVRGGRAHPLVVTGQGVSPSHAEIRLDDWDVVVTDRASTAGTFVYGPDTDTWDRLPAYQPRVLVPGSHLAVGQRVLTYLSRWTAG